MIDLTALGIFCVALALAAGSPGPSIAALVARVVVRGTSDVLPFVIAMWLGEIIWLTAAVFGLAAIAQVFHQLFVLIKYGGALYLLFLAWRMWHTDPAPVQRDSLPTGAGRMRLFAAGLAITIGNPKIMLFYLALLPTIVDVAAIGLAQWAVLAAATLVILMFVDIFWIALAARARRLLRSRRAVRLANRASATVMGSAAVIVASR